MPTRRHRTVIAAVMAALFFTAAETPSAVGWKFWEEDQQKSAPVEPRRVDERAIDASAVKPANPRKLGDEIEQVMAIIDLYRSQMEAKKNELAKLKDKRRDLSEIEEKLSREKDPKARKELFTQREKTAAEVNDLAERTAENEEVIRARKSAIAALEISLETLRQRQQAIYLRYLYRILIVAGGFVVAWALSHVATLVLDKVVREESRRNGLKKLVKGMTYAGAVVVALLAGLENPAQLAAFVAVLSAGLAIALKDLLSCCIGWFMLVFTRQIRVGDIVEIGPVKGQVTDISLLKTTLYDWKDYRETGKMVFFGNNFIFSYPLYNASLRGGDVLDSVEVRIPREVEWHRCVTALRQKLEGLRKYGEFSEFSVTSAFEQGGGLLATITFRAKPEEIPRIKELIGILATDVIWNATTQ